MPNEPYVYETVLDMCSVDFTGHWQPGAIFRAMQEAGDGHCHVLDLTFERLRGLGVAWVLSRARLHMEEYPMLGQHVAVRTWPGKTKHHVFSAAIIPLRPKEGRSDAPPRCLCSWTWTSGKSLRSRGWARPCPNMTSRRPCPSPAICARWTARSRARNTCLSTPIWI